RPRHRLARGGRPQFERGAGVTGGLRRITAVAAADDQLAVRRQDQAPHGQAQLRQLPNEFLGLEVEQAYAAGLGVAIAAKEALASCLPSGVKANPVTPP